MLSFVIPAKNEEGAVFQLQSQIIANIPKNLKYEIIFVDDGSNDNTFAELKKIRAKNKNIKIIRLRGNWGKSIALQAGFEHASGDIIFTMDADLQDDPKEIGKFLDKLDEGYDLVSGWKRKRHDPITKVIPSRILNNILVPFLTGVKIHDTNCGFKAYRADVLKNLVLYGELYRYIPILASKQNYKITEIEVHHHPRKYGKSKFGWQRNFKGLLDLITVTFLTGYLRRPAHFFGTIGLLFFTSGFIIGLYITYLRITTGTIQYRQPLLFLGMLLMIVGVQLVTTGLVAEMITSFNQRRNSTSKYISERIF